MAILGSEVFRECLQLPATMEPLHFSCFSSLFTAGAQQVSSTGQLSTYGDRKDADKGNNWNNNKLLLYPTFVCPEHEESNCWELYRCLLTVLQPGGVGFLGLSRERTNACPCRDAGEPGEYSPYNSVSVRGGWKAFWTEFMAWNTSACSRVFCSNCEHIQHSLSRGEDAQVKAVANQYFCLHFF